jgi:hypothetical protein
MAIFKLQSLYPSRKDFCHPLDSSLDGKHSVLGLAGYEKNISLCRESNSSRLDYNLVTVRPEAAWLEIQSVGYRLKLLLVSRCELVNLRANQFHYGTVWAFSILKTWLLQLGYYYYCHIHRSKVTRLDLISNYGFYWSNATFLSVILNQYIIIIITILLLKILPVIAALFCNVVGKDLSTLELKATSLNHILI